MKVRNSRVHLYPIYSIHEEAFIVNDFNVLCSMETNPSKTAFSCTPNITNNSIIDLLESGKVKLYFHIECSLTKYRSASEIHYEEKSTISVNTDMLNKQIVVSFWLATTDTLSDFEFSGLSDFYANSTYTIPPYTYIGYGDFYQFTLNKSISDNATPSSIFRISRTENNTASYVLEDTGIIIYLPSEAYIIYHDLQGNGIKEKIGIVILPVLIDLIHNIMKEYSSYESYPWYGLLESKLIDFGFPDGFSDEEFDSEKVYEFSQYIFGNVLSQALKDLASVYWGDE